MKILALESSGLVASVAVCEDDSLLGEYTINNKLTHSTTLMPMLEALSDRLDLELGTLDAIAVSGGPGSFTGLRIGSASAKGLGMVLSIPVISVPTTLGLAYNLWGAGQQVCPMMDARRSEVYTGLYRFDGDGSLEVLREQCAVPLTDMLQTVNDTKESVIFLGDGATAYEEQIRSECRVPFVFAPAHMNRQRAASVARAAMDGLGTSTSAGEHRPEYLRKSQAERERENRLKEAAEP